MTKRFAIGDPVGWNSEAGHIRGKVVAIHARDFTFLGQARHASRDEPQYEVKSDKTGHLAAHKGSALTPIG